MAPADDIILHLRKQRPESDLVVDARGHDIGTSTCIEWKAAAMLARFRNMLDDALCKLESNDRAAYELLKNRHLEAFRDLYG
jgi:hypothetical protein